MKKSDIHCIDHALLPLRASQAAIELDCAVLRRKDHPGFEATTELGEVLRSFAGTGLHPYPDPVAAYLVSAAYPESLNGDKDRMGLLAEMAKLLSEASQSDIKLQAVLRDFCADFAMLLVDERQQKRHWMGFGSSRFLYAA